MGPKLTNAILGLSKRMMDMRALQENGSESHSLTQRELQILMTLKEKGRMRVSEIADLSENVSFSTISTDITKLWRENKMVTKTIDPENQRSTFVELTPKGKMAVEIAEKQRQERFDRLYEALGTNSEEEQTLLKILTRAIGYFDNYLQQSQCRKAGS
ncbi:MAG: MarR family winged helix-turn-helix transcriptional regulator [Phycisphaerae bacterium]